MIFNFNVFNLEIKEKNLGNKKMTPRVTMGFFFYLINTLY